MDTLQPSYLQLKDLLSLFFKRQKTIFFVWIICIAFAVSYATYVKPLYESSSSILLKVGRENIYVPPQRAALDSVPVVDSNLETQMNSEVEILKSRSLIEQVLTRLGPTSIYPEQKKWLPAFGVPKSHAELLADAYKNALRLLENNLKIDGIKKTNIIRISFRHTDPDICAKVVNTLSELYLAQHLKIHQASLSLDFLRAQNSKTLDDLSNAETALINFKQRNRIIDPADQKKLLLAKEADLQAELLRTESMETETQTRFDYYKSRPAPNAAYLNVLEVLLKSESELREVKVRKPVLQMQLADYRRELEHINASENEFMNLQQQVDISRQNLRLQQNNLQEESFLAAMNKDKVSNVSVVDPAWPANDPTISREFLIILSVLFGGIAGIGLAIFKEYMDDHIVSEHDVEKWLTDLPVLTTIKLQV